MQRSGRWLLASLARQVAAEASSAASSCGPSTSGRLELGSWALTTARQQQHRWLSGGVAAAAASAAASEAAATSRRGAPTGQRRLKLAYQNYRQLSKMRLSLLVVATSAAGYAAGSDESIDWAGLGWTSLGTMLASSSANALNQVTAQFTCCRNRTTNPAANCMLGGRSPCIGEQGGLCATAFHCCATPHQPNQHSFGAFTAVFALPQVYERVNDGLMKRTMNRPLPTGRMTPRHGLAFAAVAGVGGVWLLAEKVGAGAGPVVRTLQCLK